MRTRGFEVAAGFDTARVIMPERQTCYAAGYDICAYNDYIIKPGKIAKVHTGIKAYMQSDEYLGIHIRSSIAIKHNILLANSQGIIDSDYYNNTDNDGHIIIALLNLGDTDFIIKAQDRIAQGIFYKYLCADNEPTTQSTRQGGFGSTGK